MACWASHHRLYCQPYPPVPAAALELPSLRRPHRSTSSARRGARPLAARSGSETALTQACAHLLMPPLPHRLRRPYCYCCRYWLPPPGDLCFGWYCCRQRLLPLPPPLRQWQSLQEQSQAQPSPAACHWLLPPCLAALSPKCHGTQPWQTAHPHPALKRLAPVRVAVGPDLGATEPAKSPPDPPCCPPSTATLHPVSRSKALPWKQPLPWRRPPSAAHCAQAPMPLLLLHHPLAPHRCPAAATCVSAPVAALVPAAASPCRHQTCHPGPAHLRHPALPGPLNLGHPTHWRLLPLPRPPQAQACR